MNIADKTVTRRRNSLKFDKKKMTFLLPSLYSKRRRNTLSLKFDKKKKKKWYFFYQGYSKHRMLIVTITLTSVCLVHCVPRHSYVDIFVSFELHMFRVLKGKWLSGHGECHRFLIHRSWFVFVFFLCTFVRLFRSHTFFFYRYSHDLAYRYPFIL